MCENQCESLLPPGLLQNQLFYVKKNKHCCQFQVLVSNLKEQELMVTSRQLGLKEKNGFLEGEIRKKKRWATSRAHVDTLDQQSKMEIQLNRMKISGGEQV